VNLRRSYCYSRYEGPAPDGKRLLGESIVKATCEGFVAISCEFATVIDAQYAIKVMKEQGWYPDGWVKVAYPTPTTIDLWVVQPEDGVATRALVTNPSEYMICNGLSWRKCGSRLPPHPAMSLLVHVMEQGTAKRVSLLHWLMDTRPRHRLLEGEHVKTRDIEALPDTTLGPQWDPLGHTSKVGGWMDPEPMCLTADSAEYNGSVLMLSDNLRSISLRFNTNRDTTLTLQPRDLAFLRRCGIRAIPLSASSGRLDTHELRLQTTQPSLPDMQTPGGAKGWRYYKNGARCSVEETSFSKDS
jgi:hypothetical protein